MNINELSDRNINDAVALYKESTKDYINYLFSETPTNEEIAEKFLDDEKNGDFTYLFYDHGSFLAMATVAKGDAEIRNMYINFDLVDDFFHEKYLEFLIKQFSAITRVFVWVVSTNSKVVDMLEESGFEYTGEQEYVCKEKNILRYHYLYKRKK